MVIEVGSAGIPWMKPRDITVEEAVTFVTDPAASQFQQVHPGGVNVLMADGAVRFVGETINCGIISDPETSGPSPYGVWGALGTMQGGEPNVGT